MIQTWLPLPDFKDSVVSLHIEELTRQRYDVLQLCEFFHGVEPSNTQMPDHIVLDHMSQSIVNMWTGYELQLIEYGLACCDEWAVRIDVETDPFTEKLALHLDWAQSDDAEMGKPNWFGDVEFHLSHQAALRKIKPKWYGRLFLNDGDRSLVWPVSDYAS